MIILEELKLISEAIDLNSINEIISKLENSKDDINVSKELLKSAIIRRNEILKEDTAYYPQSNTKNTFVIDASPEINKNFGSDKIGYFKLFDLKITPNIDYMTSQCWRINILYPSYEIHYNSLIKPLNSKEKRQLISILNMPYLNQYTKKQISNKIIDPDYDEISRILLKEYNNLDIVFSEEEPMIVYVWNVLLYKINKVNNLINKKSAFPLLSRMPDYNVL